LHAEGGVVLSLDPTAPSDRAPQVASVERIADERQLAELKEAWNHLAGELPFLRFEWAETWWRHYRQTGDSLFVLTVRDRDGRLVGLAPWYVGRRFGRRVVQFLGSGEVCSDYQTVLSLPGWEQQVASAIAAHLDGPLRSAWDLVELVSVEPERHALAFLIRDLEGRGHAIHQRPGQNCWQIDLPATWESFVASLSKRRRANVRSLVRRSLASNAVVRLVTTEEELDRGFEILRNLHQRRHVSAGKAGCFASARFTRFHREMAGTFLAAGKLRLQWIELHGEPIAAEYDFIGGNTAYYYQSGMEPAQFNQSPGSLSLIASISRAIEQGYRTFDMLRGDEEYKAVWGARPVPMSEVRVAGLGISSRLHHRAWIACERLRKWRARARRLSR